MKDKWRLIKADFTSYMDFRNSLNFGILRARKENLVPNTLVQLRLLKSSVCASYYPDIEKDTDLTLLRQRGIEIKRFMGGAGIGLVGRGMLVCLLYVSTDGVQIPVEYQHLLETILKAIAEAIKRDFKVDCSFCSPNYLIVGGKKICFSSVTFEDKIANFSIDLQVKEPELDTIRDCLPISFDRVNSNGDSSLEKELTWLERETGRNVSIEEASQTLTQAIQNTFDMELYESELTEAEYLLAQEVFNIYDSDEWQMSRTEKMRFGKIANNVKRTEYRMEIQEGTFLKAVVLRSGNMIKDILITGNIQCWPVEFIDQLEDRIRNTLIDEKIILEKVARIFKQQDAKILGGNPNNLTQLIMSAATQ